jgi:hypothetical protein
MFAIASKGACFIMRQHGSLKHWQTLGKENYVGKTDSGKVYEQKIIITDLKTQKGLAVRILVGKVRQYETATICRLPKIAGGKY